MRALCSLTALILITGCSVHKTDEAVYTSDIAARAVGIAHVIEEGMTLLNGMSERRSTLYFRPPSAGAYTVVVIPSDGFNASHLADLDLDDEVVARLEAELYRHGGPAKSTILFYQHDDATVTSTTAHNRQVNTPRLLWATKQGGSLGITLEKGEAGLGYLVGLE